MEPERIRERMAAEKPGLAVCGLIVGRGESQLDGCTVLSMTPIVTAKHPLEGEAPPPTSPTSICELVFPSPAHSTCICSDCYSVPGLVPGDEKEGKGGREGKRKH